MSSTYKERLSHLESVLLLDKVHIDISQLRASCKYGIADVFRPLCWRLLLDYLPVQRNEWLSHLQKQRETYEYLVNDVIVHPGQSSSSSATASTADDDDDGLYIEDHPLSLNPNSEWRNYFKDNEVLLQIDKDVRRLYPEMQFFQRKTNYPHKSAAKLNLSKRLRQENLQAKDCDTKYDEYSAGSFLTSSAPTATVNDEYANDMTDEDGERHWQVVERILFIYSKLNPGVKYVQGMNEIVGPLYYVFANDTDEEWAEFAEADTYYCFQLLMSEIKDNFIKKLDHSNCGIEWLMGEFHERLRIYDASLYEHLVINLQIKAPFYAFRWLSLLLSQEFPLPDVITIWDSLFASTDRLCLLQWICLAMIERKRDCLMNADFSTSLRLLQNYREADVGQLIVQAYDMYENSSQRRTSSNSEQNNSPPPDKSTSTSISSSTKIATVLSNAIKSLSKK